MNRGITLLAVAVLNIITFAGCKKNTDVPSYSMKATVGNDAYVNNNCQAIMVGTSLVIQGLGTSSPFPVYPYIEIDLPNWSALQTRYFFDSSGSNSHARYIVDATHIKTSAYGWVIINSVSDRMMSGQFNFTTTDTVNISGGTFVAKIAP